MVEINKAKGENKVVLQDELKGLYKTILGYQEQKKELVGLINQLERINHSSFGKLFNVSKNDALTITKIRKEKACLYIGLPTQGFGDIARSVGKIFLGELLYHSDLYQTIYADSHISINNPLSVYFDETGSIIVPDFIELLNKCRSSGVQCTTCIQSISDLDRVSENIKEAIIESTSSNLIIFKQAVSRNAEFLSSLIGTFESTKETNVMEDGEIQTKGSTRDVQKFFCSPNLFKRMPVGKGILVRWNPFRVELVNFRDTRKSMVFKEIQRSVDQKMEATVSKADEISKKTSPQSSGGKNIY
ncbi:MAG: TraM recognition domain-containing protein [Bacteriovoracaceae bacterium]|nr:TraM recognition domain-containing protein [Bacteriovoracaceae bacterium]